MLKEESGYALLIVLLTIVLVGIAAVPLINQTLTSAQQVEVVKAQAKADEMRTYGERYFQQRTAVTIEESIRTFEAALWEEEERRIGSRDLEALYAYLRNSLQDEYSRFTAADPLGITPVSGGEGTAAVVPEAVTLDTAVDGAGIQIRYESIGEAGGRESREAQLLEFSFQLDGGGEPAGGIYDMNDTLNAFLSGDRQELVSDQNRYRESTVVQGPVIYEQDLEFITGGSVNGELTIEGDAYGFGRIRAQNSDSIYVNGNLFHEGAENGSSDNIQTNPGRGQSIIVVNRDMLVDSFSLQNQAQICVRGAVYERDGSTIRKVQPTNRNVHLLDTESGESCDDASSWNKGVVNIENQDFSSSSGSQPITSTSGWILRSGNSQ